jgi:hypothetical protein
MTTTQIDNEFNNIAAIRSVMIDPVKLQLHSGVEGFDSPESFGIYRKTGGKPLGTVGRVYEPPNLNNFLDSIVKSVAECCSDQFDLSELKYTEYKEGAKVSFDLPGESFEVKSKVIGDVFQTKIHFFTGFDGLTKSSLSFSVLRLVCLNGAKQWQKDIDLSFKNTLGNVGKLEYFGHQVVQLRTELTTYQESLNRLAQKQVTQPQIDIFLKNVFGYNSAEYKDLTTRRKNILDRINESVAIEQRDLGTNLYSLLQGVTRYTSHELGDSAENTFFGGASEINQKAHAQAFALLN